MWLEHHLGPKIRCTMHHPSTLIPQLVYTLYSDASTKLDTWPGTCSADGDPYTKELNQMESFLLNLRPMSWSPVVFMLGSSRRCNMNVQQELMGFVTRVQHRSNYRRDLSCISSQKHLFQLKNWRGGHILLPALLSVSYLSLFLQHFCTAYLQES